MVTVVESGIFVSWIACAVVLHSDIVSAARKVVMNLMVFSVMMLCCLSRIVTRGLMSCKDT